MIFRILSGLILVLGLFFLPWLAVFFMAAGAAAVFPWFLEFFAVAFFASILSASPLLGFFAVSAAVILTQEWLKKRFDVSKPVSVLYTWISGAFIFLLSAAVFL